MKVLGIDPGLATIGLGLVESSSPHDIHAIEWLTITTKAGLETPERLLEIQKDLTEYILESQPDLIVIEKIYFAVNEKTVIDVAQARGVIIVTSAASGVPILEATPLQMKLCITGDGKADKRQVQDMLVLSLKLEEIPTPDDAADGLALAMYGAIQGINKIQDS